MVLKFEVLKSQDFWKLLAGNRGSNHFWVYGQQRLGFYGRKGKFLLDVCLWCIKELWLEHLHWASRKKGTKKSSTSG